MAKKLKKGKPLTELVKGSLNYTMYQIRQVFRQKFDPDYELGFYVHEIFADHVIVSHSRELKTDEYYRVAYSYENGNYVFAERNAWDVVELTYKPVSLEEVKVLEESPPDSPKKLGRNKGKRFVETIEDARLELMESEEDNADGPWRIKGIGNVAGVVNGNKRRYSAPVLAAAVRELGNHLHESAGQGRMMVLGEPDHPASKGNRHPELLETVVNWENVAFDGSQILLEGLLLGTSKGKDIRAQMLGGVKPGISQRAYGDGKMITENGNRFLEVDWVKITGFDLTAPNQQSAPGAGVTMFESVDELEEEMDPKELAKLIKDNPELFESLIKGKVEEMTEAQLEAVEATVRETLGLGEEADIPAALQEMKAAQEKMAAQEQQQKIDEAIEDACKDLPYDELNESFEEALKTAKPESAEAVQELAEAKRTEYDAIVSRTRLNEMGFGGANVQVRGPVIEKELGIPQFAEAAFMLTESIRQSELRERRDFRQPKTINEEFTALYLAKFDEQYRAQLIQEAKLFAEAEQTSDLNLPYSVSRAIIAEAFPELVATSIFDVGLIESSPTRLYFEAFSGETGYEVSVTDEEVVADEDAWVALDYKRLEPGSVVVTTDPAGTTYDEGDDYVIDYANGEIMCLSTGDISDEDDLLVDYDYFAIRKGEMGVIERGKETLSYVTVEAAADRLAQQISDEAVVFSRSQLGWDATTKTLASLIRQMRRRIDEGLIRLALASALQVASNSGGTWTAATDPVSELVEKLGVAKVKVANRYYTPTFYLLSMTNSDVLANWDGFTAAGKRPDSDLKANGFVGRVKGLPVFESTEMADGWGLTGNRELVMHRIFKAMNIKGPYPTYDVSGGTSKLVAAEQYYAEEYNLTESPVPEKGAYVVIG